MSNWLNVRTGIPAFPEIPVTLREPRSEFAGEPAMQGVPESGTFGRPRLRRSAVESFRQPTASIDQQVFDAGAGVGLRQRCQEMATGDRSPLLLPNEVGNALV